MAPKHLSKKSSSQTKRRPTSGLHTRYTTMKKTTTHIYQIAHQRLLIPSWMTTPAGLIPGLLALYANRKFDRRFDRRSERQNYLPLHESQAESLLIPYLFMFYLPILVFIPPKTRNKWYNQLLFTLLIGLLLFYVMPYHKPSFQDWSFQYLETFLAVLLTASPFCAALAIEEDGEMAGVETGITYLKSQWRAVKVVLEQLSSVEIRLIATSLICMVAGGLLFLLE